jgi:hypothetical protein
MRKLEIVAAQPQRKWGARIVQVRASQWPCVLAPDCQALESAAQKKAGEPLWFARPYLRQKSQ